MRKRNLLLPALFLALAFISYGLQKVAARSQPIHLLSPSKTVIRFSPWDLVMAVAWSPDGKLLAVSAGDAIHLVQSEDGKIIFSYSIGAFTHSLAFSPDGRRLAAGSRDGRVRLWEIDQVLQAGLLQSDQTSTPQAHPASTPASSGQPRLSIAGHKKGVNSVTFSPDGKQLASGGNDAVARLWDVTDGHLLVQIIGGSYAVPVIAYSPKGDILGIVNGRFLRLREVSAGRITGTFRTEEPLFSLAYSPDGNWLAAGDSNNNVLLWNPAEGFRAGSTDYPTPVHLAGHYGQPGKFDSLIWRVAFSPDSRWVASAGGDGNLCIWEVQSGRLLSTLEGHTAGVTSLAFSADGRRLVSGSLDGTVRLWDLNELP